MTSWGKPKRWVVYNGYAEASAIAPGWHGWMHYRTDTPPSQEDYKPREWQKGHKPNLTGTPLAYHPQGSLATGGERARVTGDYDAWTPGN
jgi:NADH:ubiquinone oxidoreductase subunit